MPPHIPYEIVAEIISYLPSLSPYASVSREWQSIIEHKTFSDILLTPQRLPEFQRIFSASHRRCHTQDIKFEVTLPEYDITSRSQFENEEDRQRNNLLFTAAIRALFETLASWEDEYALLLSIWASSPSDFIPGPENFDRRAAARQNRRKDLLEARYEHSYLRVVGLDADPLPEVSVVVDLDIRLNPWYRKIAPSAVSAMVACLPRVRTVWAQLSDNERHDSTLRQSLREEFATSLAQWPWTIKHLNLRYTGDPPQDERFPPPERSEEGEDSLSLALNRFSKQLETLEMRQMMISSELFWLPENVTQPAIWDHLTYLSIDYAIATPSGEWLFERDVENDKYKEHTSTDPYFVLPIILLPPEQDYWEMRFRTKPMQRLNEFYLAAGRAAQHMPKLERMVLEANIKAHFASHWFQYQRDSETATWAGTSRFDLDEEVKNVWIKAGRKHGIDGLRIENVGFDDCPFPFRYDDVVSNPDLKQRCGYRSWD